VQRLTIVLGSVDDHAGRWCTTTMRSWRADEREQLFSRLHYVPLPPHRVGGSLPKVGSEMEADLLDRLFQFPPIKRLLTKDSERGFWYKRRWSYYLLFLNFIPPMLDEHGDERLPTEFKWVGVTDDVDPLAILAAYSSSLFYWYFTVFADNRNVNRRELDNFPFPNLSPQAHNELAALGNELMVSLRENSELRTCTYGSIGTIQNTYFRQAGTQPVIDRIDACLARCYGLTDEQLVMLTALRTGR
jgi:hypothetical protein